MTPQPPPSPHPSAQPAATAGAFGVSLVFADCLTGALTPVSQFPYLLHTVSPQGRTVAVEFSVAGGAVVLAPASGVAAGETRVNGGLLRGAVSLPPGEVFTLSAGNRLLLLQVNPAAEWAQGFDHAVWQVYDTGGGQLLGEIPPREIPATAVSQGWDPAACAACPRGLDTGFFLSEIADILAAPGAAVEGVGAISANGRLLCPACWLRFDAGDALNVAAHESLRGDPVLGDAAMLRFYPTRFNDLGQALDPMGLVSTELACPHCRRQLPPGHMDLAHKIFSLIGAPSAGKSYFLAVLTRVLQERLFQDFGIVFKDGDPTGNMVLNQMRTKLFSGATPEDCALGKTAMEGGATYEFIPRHGKVVAMPRPFIYILENGRGGGPGGNAVIFYDNAGEHFEPGHDTVDSPGALHVVNSSGILFLFDPTSNLRFRQELAGVSDPQLHQDNRDQQDSIFSEMEVRVKKMLALGPGQRIPVPIAFLVGKCDVWQSLLDTRNFPRPVSDGTFDASVVDANSAPVRALLARLCPGLVAQAESLSEDVRYFAVSPLGHSPAPIASGPNTGMLAPDPLKIAPLGIEAPLYWLLDKAIPGFFPARKR